MTGPKPKARYAKSPAKGTQARKLILLMLRQQGATTKEAQAHGIKGTVATTIIRLRDYGGWDIRVFPMTKVEGTRGRSEVTYKIVGRYRWNATYRELNRMGGM